METKNEAKCVCCQEVKIVCCNHGFNADGTNIDPWCKDCCPGKKYHHKHIADGKNVAGGIYERGE